MSQRFGSERRLRSRQEFTVVQHTGTRVVMRYLTLLGRANSLGRDRLGIIASRRVGGAVRRNRAKRRIRELFRRRAIDAAPVRPLDLVVIPRDGFLDAPFTDLASDFAAALARLRARVSA